MGFKSRSDQISHTLLTAHHRCNLGVWALAQSRGVRHRLLVNPERVLSEYNEDLIFIYDQKAETFIYTSFDSGVFYLTKHA